MRQYAKTDQEKEEMTEASTRAARNEGFKLMHVRDKGSGMVRGLDGSSVVLDWHVSSDRRQEGRPYETVPDGAFKISIGGQSVVIDADEFRKLFRWV